MKESSDGETLMVVGIWFHYKNPQPPYLLGMGMSPIVAYWLWGEGLLWLTEAVVCL